MQFVAVIFEYERNGTQIAFDSIPIHGPRDENVEHNVEEEEYIERTRTECKSVTLLPLHFLSSISLVSECHSFLSWCKCNL